MSAQSIPCGRRRLLGPSLLSGGAPSLEGLGDCSEYLLQSKLKWPFCKGRSSAPLLELALQQSSGERGLRTSPGDLPPARAAPAPHARPTRLEQLPAPGEPSRPGTRRASVTSPGTGPAPGGGGDVTRAACEGRKLPEPHLAGPGQRSPPWTVEEPKGEGHDAFGKPAGAQIGKRHDHVGKRAEPPRSRHWVAFSSSRTHDAPLLIERLPLTSGWPTLNTVSRSSL